MISLTNYDFQGSLVVSSLFYLPRRLADWILKNLARPPHLENCRKVHIFITVPMKVIYLVVEPPTPLKNMSSSNWDSIVPNRILYIYIYMESHKKCSKAPTSYESCQHDLGGGKESQDFHRVLRMCLSTKASPVP